MQITKIIVKENTHYVQDCALAQYSEQYVSYYAMISCVIILNMILNNLKDWSENCERII